MDGWSALGALLWCIFNWRILGDRRDFEVVGY